MRLITIAGLAAVVTLGAGSAVLAQDQSDPGPPPGYPNPNVQAAQDYQAARDVYQDQAAAAQRQSEDYSAQSQAYAQRSADYDAMRRAFRYRMREYERARDAYDAQYGYGAYERIYPAPAPPY